MSRREAIAKDLQREHNRLEKTKGTDTPPLISQSIAQSIAFLEKQRTQLNKEINEPIKN